MLCENLCCIFLFLKKIENQFYFLNQQINKNDFVSFLQLTIYSKYIKSYRHFKIEISRFYFLMYISWTFFISYYRFKKDVQTHIYYLIFSGFLILLFHTKNNKYLFFNRPMNPTNLTPTDLWTNSDLVASFLDLDESGVIQMQAPWTYSLLWGYSNDAYSFLLYN